MQGGTLLSPRHIQGTGPEPARCHKAREVMARVGDKWSIEVVMWLAREPRRFNQLKRAIDGVSQRMLTLTLRSLERDGLVSRTVFPTIPPRVDYALTRLGRSLCKPVIALGAWAHQHTPQIDEARAKYDRAHPKRSPSASHR